MLNDGCNHRQDSREHEGESNSVHTRTGSCISRGAVDSGDDVVETKSETDQSQAGADPGHQRALSGITVALAGQLVGEIYKEIAERLCDQSW